MCLLTGHVLQVTMWKHVCDSYLFLNIHALTRLFVRYTLIAYHPHVTFPFSFPYSSCFQYLLLNVHYIFMCQHLTSAKHKKGRISEIGLAQGRSSERMYEHTGS